jgi:hypothetical protein
VQILRFLARYWRAKVFDADAQVPMRAAGLPEAFVAELEALGPAFVKIGQALSTRADLVQQALAPALDVRAVMEEHLTRIAGERLRSTLSRTHLAAGVHELQSLLQYAPRRLDDLLSILAENRLQVQLTGLEEAHLVENLQKIANRIAAGVVVAALILASALMMRVDTGARVLGVPALSFVLFMIATVLGLCIVVGALLHDHSSHRTRR